MALVVFAAGLVVCGTAPSMEVLVAGRVLQGLGAGAMTVCLYVVVGLVFPAVLQPAVFASFAAAWVLPSLFGPALAAFVAHALGWRWVFLGVVVLVAASTLLILPALRGLRAARAEPRRPSGRGWCGPSSAPSRCSASSCSGRTAAPSACSRWSRSSSSSCRCAGCSPPGRSSRVVACRR